MIVARRVVAVATRPVPDLPTITADQLRSGARQFPVRGVNLQSVRVTAQLVAPEAAAQAVEAFAKYAKEGPEDENAPHEFYQPLPPGLIKATPLAERTVALPGAVLDARQETLVDWTDILGGQKAGVIFLTVEGQPLAGTEAGQKRPGAQALIQLTDLGVLWKRADGRLHTTVKRAEALPCSPVGPLEVVQQRPGEVPLDLDLVNPGTGAQQR